MRTIPTKLAFSAVLFSALAWYVSLSSTFKTEQKNEFLYPSLLDQFNDITFIEISGSGQNTKLARNDYGWTVANRDSYPANTKTIVKSLLEISELRTIEPKRKLPKGHKKLGLMGPDIEPFISRQILIRGLSDQTIVNLIIGKSAQGLEGNYVRKNAENQSWLARGMLSLSPDPMTWLDTEIMDVPSKRIKAIKINNPEHREIYISRKTSDTDRFSLNNIPEGYEVKSRSSLASLASLTEQLRFVDVRSRDRIKNSNISRTIRITTFDSLVIEMTQYDSEEGEWVEFQFLATNSPAPDENSPSTKVNELTNRTRDWIYVLPAYKQRIYKKSLASLIQKKNLEE